MKGIAQVADFGKLAAENDVALQDYFVRTPAFERIMAMDRYLVLGRKGSGKTALYEGLEASRGPHVFVSGLKFNDYPWMLHNAAISATAAEKERYVNSWYFLILVELAKLALANQARPNAAACNALIDFIKVNWGEVEFSYKDFYRPERFATVSSEIRPTVASNSLASVQRQWVPRTKLGDSVAATIKWLETTLAEVMTPGSRHFVTFDELDTAFSWNDDEYLLRLIGLFLAAKRTANWSDSSGLQARAVVFIRSDIFQRARFPDKNKLASDRGIAVEWTDQESGPESLRTLMDERIRYALEAGPSTANPWDLVFDPSETVRGPYQRKFQYMADRTYLRPRDMIRFANLALDCAKKRIARGGDSGLIVNEDIILARRDYSEHLIAEFEDDLVGFASDDWHQCLEPIRRIRKEVFSREQWDAEFRRLPRWPENMQAVDVLERLYDWSFVGFLRRGGALGGSNVVFRYKSPRVEMDPAATEFRVHLGLKDALGVVEERGPSRKAAG